jgi:hypothetical protein
LGVAQSKNTNGKERKSGSHGIQKLNDNTRDTIALLFHTFVLMMSLVVVVVLE